MSEVKCDVVLQFGQLDTSTWYAYKYLKNEHYGVEIIQHNVTPEEAQQYVMSHGMNHVYEKEEENSHLEGFHASCFWTLAQED